MWNEDVNRVAAVVAYLLVLLVLFDKSEARPSMVETEQRNLAMTSLAAMSDDSDDDVVDDTAAEVLAIFETVDRETGEWSYFPAIHVQLCALNLERYGQLIFFSKYT